MISNLRASESATYDALLETLGYIHVQYHAGRKIDGAGNEYMLQLVGAIQAKWIAGKVATLAPKGKMQGKVELADIQMELAPELSRVLNEQKAKNLSASMKRNQAKADKAEEARTERVSAYTQATAPQEEHVERLIDVETALIVKGVVIDLSDSEAEALVAYLDMMRKPKLMVA
jgi:uncharacterized protein involved in outer membrane biogenesis